MPENDTIKVIIEADGKRYARTINKIEKKNKKFGKGVDTLSGQVKGFTKSLRYARHAMIALAAIKLSKQVLKNGLAFERMTRTLEYATGSIEAAEKQAFNLMQTSEHLGLSFLSTAESYSLFTAAVKGSDIESKANEIFLGISTGITALGLSAYDARGIYKSLEQMVSKGNVQAEEIRGQFGERFPGALRLAARAMGKTTKEFNKMLEQGEVLANDLLPKLASLIKEEFGEAAVEASKSGVASINRLSSAWSVFMEKLYNSEGLSFVTNALTGTLDAISGREVFVNIKKTTEELSKLYAEIERIIDPDYTVKYKGTPFFDQEEGKKRLISPVFERIARLEEDLQAARLASFSADELNIAAENIQEKIAKAEEKLLNRPSIALPMLDGKWDKITERIEKYQKLLDDTRFKIEEAKDIELDEEYSANLHAEDLDESKRYKAITEIVKANEKLRVDFLYNAVERKRVLLNTDFENQKKAAEDSNTLNSEEFQVYKQQYLEAHQQLADEEVRINREAQQKKLEDATDAQSGIKRALADYYKSINNSAKQYEGLAKNAFNGLEEDFIRFTKTGKLSFKDMTDSIIKDLIRIAVQKQVVGFLGNFDGYLTGSTSPGLQKTPSAGANNIGFAHGGAIIGKGFTFSRSVNSSVFQGANRYHAGGIAKNEVPAILQKGEGVFTVEQMKALTPAGNKNPTVRVNIINNTQSTATQSQTNNADGSTDIEVLIGVVDDALGEMFTLGTGSLFGAVESRG